MEIKETLCNGVSTQYIVNKETRTIFCIITAVNDVPKRLAKYGLADEKYDGIDFDVREYKGVARCAPEDVWDEKFGKRLAEYRAAKARQVDVNNDLMSFKKCFAKSLDDLCEYGMMKNPHKPTEKLKIFLS